MGQSPHVNIIHLFQKMAQKLVMNVPKLTHSAPLFHQSKVKVIKNRVTFRTIYNSLNELTPDYMKKMFEKVSNISARSTCLTTTINLYVPKHNLGVNEGFYITLVLHSTTL